MVIVVRSLEMANRPPVTPAGSNCTPALASSSQTPATNPDSTPSLKRRKARTWTEKIGLVLDQLDEVGWSLPKFLEEFFTIEEASSPATTRSNRHQQCLNSMLNGATQPRILMLLELLYRNALKVKFRGNDNSVPPGEQMFHATTRPEDIEHAYPGMTTWAVRLVGDLVDQEAMEMTERSTGLHLRATAKAGTRNEAHKISWDAVGEFSMKGLEDVAAKHAPVMSFLTNAYTVKEFAAAKPGQVVAVQTYRLQNLVS